MRSPNTLPSLNAIWNPAPLQPVPIRLYIAGVCLLLSYAFMKIAFYDQFKLLEPFLIAVALYTFFRYGSHFRTSLPALLFFASIITATIVWLAAYYNHPELVRSSPSPLHLGRHFAFIAFAFWISGHTRNSLTFFGVILLGLFLVPWTQGDGFAELLVAIQGQRVNYGLGWQHGGMLFGVAILALVVFFPRITSYPRFSIVRFVIWLSLFSFSAFSIFVTQTRSVFLALTLVVIIAGFFLLYKLFSNWRTIIRSEHDRSRYIPFSALTLVLALSLALSFHTGAVGWIVDRYGQELVVLDEIRAGDLDDITINSIGARIVSWQAGAEWFMERPLLGWGPNGGAIVMQNTPSITNPYLLGFGHMHSSYFETVIRYGLLGLSIYVILAFWVAYYSFRAWEAGAMPSDFFSFFILFFIYWAVVNFFESFMFYTTGVFVFNAVMAAQVSFIWKYQATLSRKLPTPQGKKPI